MRRMFLLSIALPALGCTDPLTPQTDAQKSDPCPVLGTTDWRARVGPVAGAEGPHLIVEGIVTLPTPAWSVTLDPGIATRSATPVQRVNLSATPPQMMTTQVLTDYALRLETPSISAAPLGMAPYGGVLVLCGGQVLVELTDIGLAGDQPPE